MKMFDYFQRRTVVILTLLLLILIGVSLMYINALKRKPFDKVAWDLDKTYPHQVREEMLYSLANDVLKNGMSKIKVEHLIGKPDLDYEIGNKGKASKYDISTGIALYVYYDSRENLISRHIESD